MLNQFILPFLPFIVNGNFTGFFPVQNICLHCFNFCKTFDYVRVGINSAQQNAGSG